MSARVFKVEGMTATDTEAVFNSSSPPPAQRNAKVTYAIEVIIYNGSGNEAPPGAGTVEVGASYRPATAGSMPQQLTFSVATNRNNWIQYIKDVPPFKEMEIKTVGLTASHTADVYVIEMPAA